MTDNKKPEVKYSEFSKEEQHQVQADVDAVLAKHQAEIVIAPVITPQGTIGAVAQVFRKVLAEQGTPSPFVPQPEANGGATEPAPEGASESAPKAD